MASLIRERQARHAIESQVRAGPYRWPDRSCLSLARAVSLALTGVEPDYEDAAGVALPREWRAARVALARVGGFAAAHRAVLERTGRWSVAAPPWEPGDLVCLRPPLQVALWWYRGRARHEMLAAVGPECDAWCWTVAGVARVASPWRGQVAVGLRAEG